MPTRYLLYILACQGSPTHTRHPPYVLAYCVPPIPTRNLLHLNCTLNPSAALLLYQQTCGWEGACSWSHCRVSVGLGCCRAGRLGVIVNRVRSSKPDSYGGSLLVTPVALEALPLKTIGGGTRPSGDNLFLRRAGGQCARARCSRLYIGYICAENLWKGPFTRKPPGSHTSGLGGGGGGAIAYREQANGSLSRRIPKVYHAGKAPALLSHGKR